MKKETQENWILEQLEDKGFISRNQCLEHYISRLGAIICDLQNRGYVFTAEYQKTPNGRDYVYTLLKKPEPKGLFDIPSKKLVKDLIKYS